MIQEIKIKIIKLTNEQNEESNKIIESKITLLSQIQQQKLLNVLDKIYQSHQVFNQIQNSVDEIMKDNKIDFNDTIPIMNLTLYLIKSFEILNINIDQETTSSLLEYILIALLYPKIQNEFMIEIIQKILELLLKSISITKKNCFACCN